MSEIAVGHSPAGPGLRQVADKITELLDHHQFPLPFLASHAELQAIITSPQVNS